MPRPSSVTAEVEFTAGVWTDVSADVDWSVGWSFQPGRTSPQGVPQTSTLSVTLFNAKGKYTPGLQTLSDGTAAPFWPNVVTRKRLRVSVNGTVRWLGYIKGWYPQLVNGVLGKVVVQAADRNDALARVTVLSAFRQAIMTQGPTYYWPMTEAAGSTSAAEVITGSPAMRLRAGTTTAFGAAGPVASEGTGVAATAPSAGTTGGLQVTFPLSALPGAFTLIAWFNPTALPGWVVSGPDTSYLLRTSRYFGGLLSPGYEDLFLDPVNGWELTAGGPVSFTLFTPDSNWHMLTIQNDGTSTFLSVDGGPRGGTPTGPVGGPLGILYVGSDELGTQMFQGGMGQMVIYNRALSDAQINGIYQAGLGYYGETVNTRIARFLGYAGLTAPDYSLDTSTVALGTYDQAGKDVLTACQDAAQSEGGGSVFYLKAGTAVFKNRNARKPGAPALTLDAVRDLDRNVWQPSEDDSTQLNQIIVNRNDGSGTLSTRTIDKSAGGPVLNTTITTYTATDSDALNTAQDVLAQNLTPGFRLPQVSVDLVHAENNLYTAAFTVGIGSRIRVANIPTGQAPATQVDVIVEGWHEEYSKPGGVESYRMTFDTSPADSPPVAVWDDATYGRWQCDGQTLNATVTAVASSLAIATPAGKPTFTTDPTMYPLNITIGAEIITLNSVPGGSTTPQTFTGVTRGVSGTAASAQTAGASVNIYQPSTWAL